MTQGPQPQGLDYMAEILRRAGLVDEKGAPDPTLAPIGFSFSWGSKPGAFHGAGLWKAEHPVLFENYGFLSIAFLFQNDTEVRVYAMPKSDPPKDPATGAPLVMPVPHRFTLNKSTPAYFVEIIANPEVLMDEVAAELIELRDAGSSVQTAELLDAARELIRQGDVDGAIDLLREEDDDEEEEDAPQPGDQPAS